MKFGQLSIDGTKVRANASKHKAMSYGRMVQEEARLKSEISALLSTADARDVEEDRRHEAAVGEGGVPAELQRRSARLAAIGAAKARYEAAQRAGDDARERQPDQDRNPKGGRPYKRDYGEPKAKAQGNFTDPESRIMKTGDGFQQCYNAQLAVDGEAQLIVATRLGPEATDQGQMLPLLDEIEGTFAVRPDGVPADAGYCNEADLAALEAQGIDGHVALGREGKARTRGAGGTLPATTRMGAKLAMPEGRAVYGKCKWLSEASHGWIKEALGFRRFSFRGLAKVRGGWDLVCLSLNIRRRQGLMAA